MSKEPRSYTERMEDLRILVLDTSKEVLPIELHEDAHRCNGQAKSHSDKMENALPLFQGVKIDAEN